MVSTDVIGWPMASPSLVATSQRSPNIFDDCTRVSPPANSFSRWTYELDAATIQTDAAVRTALLAKALGVPLLDLNRWVCPGSGPEPSCPPVVGDALEASWETEEGRKAQQLLNTTLPQLENSEFKKDSSATNIKLLYSFAIAEKEQAGAVKEQIEKAISEVGYDQYYASLDFYDEEIVLVTVHGIENINRAQGLAETLKVNPLININTEPVVISSENYRVAQLHKNLNAYIETGDNIKQQ